MRPTTALLVLTLCLSACKKQAGDSYKSYFENKTDKVLFIDLYHNQDYLRDNFVKQIELPPHSTTKIPSDNLEDGEYYFCDWYNADYTYTGWIKRPTTTYTRRGFYYSKNNGTSYPLYADSGRERIIVLGGNGRETVWRAVDAYDTTGISIWNSLTPKEKDHKIILSYGLKIMDSNSSGSNLDTTLAQYYDMPKVAALFQLQTYPEYKIICSDLNAFSIAPLTSTSEDTLFYVTPSRNNKNKFIYTTPLYKLAKVETRY